MTTIAQKLLEGRIQTTPTDADMSATMSAYVIRHLSTDITKVYKDKQNHPHIAERYIFTDSDPADRLRDAIESGQLSFPVIFQKARLPVDTAWIEWKLVKGQVDSEPQIGLFIDTTPIWSAAGKLLWQQDFHTLIAVYFATHPNQRPRLVMVICTTEPLGGREHVHYFVPYQEHNPETADVMRTEMSKLLLEDLMALLFLITTPRATEVVHQKWSSQLQKARVRRGKVPLVEYKKVTLNIGAPRRIVVTSEHTGPSGPRRLHQVVGHWRTYLQGRNEPHVTWVPQHWRGDPKLGIVMHDRTVVLPKGATP